MIGRRHFVIATGVGVLASGFGVGEILNAQRTAPAAATPGSTPPPVPAGTAHAEVHSMADMPGMASLSGPSTTSDLSVRGHSVRLTQTATAATLTIDGRHPIPLTRPVTGTLYTHLLPFTTYDDPKVLVRDVLACSRSGLFVV